VSVRYRPSAATTAKLDSIGRTIHRRPVTRPWVATTKLNKSQNFRYVYVGCYPTKEEAREAIRSWRLVAKEYGWL